MGAQNASDRCKQTYWRIGIHNNKKKHSHNNVKVDIHFTAVGLFASQQRAAY